MAVDVSFCVCAYNARDRIEPTLRALARQQGDLNIEYILIDNKSSDGTGEFARTVAESANLPLRIIREETPGLAAARLRAVCESAGRILIYVDDDNHLAPDYAQKAVDFLTDHPSVGLVGGCITPVFDTHVTPPDNFDEFKGLLALTESTLTHPVQKNPHGAGLCGRREIFEASLQKVGLLLTGRKGAALTGGEDHEILSITKRLGWECWITPDLKLDHYIPESRLQTEYINKLMCASAQCFPWLQLLNSRHAIPGRAHICLKYVIKAYAVRLKYQILGLLGQQPTPGKHTPGFWADWWTHYGRGGLHVLRNYTQAKHALQCNLWLDRKYHAPGYRDK